MNAIIGHTGFVGSNLIEKMNFDYMFNSKNINEISKHSYDLIVCSGIPASKYIANKFPENDIENINKLIENLRNVNCNKFILISSIDVYENTSNNPELIKCSKNHHFYGLHRQYAEEELKKIFSNITIIRLPALFGKGLKKNILFDLINNKFFNKINIRDTYQWYYISDLAEDIKYIITNNIIDINLFSEPIMIEEFIDKFFQYNINEMYCDVNTAINYNLKTGLKNKEYWNTKQEIIKKLRLFLHE